MNKFREIKKNMSINEQIYHEIKTKDILSFKITTMFLKIWMVFYVMYILTIMFLLQVNTIVPVDEDLGASDLALTGVEFIFYYFNFVVAGLVITLILDLIILYVRLFYHNKWLKER